MRAATPDREERALEVRAHDRRVGRGERRDHAEARDDVVERIRDKRDDRARRAMGAVRVERLPYFVRTVVIRGAPTAVTVQIDEPGREGAAGDIDRGRSGRRSIRARMSGTEAGRRDAVPVEEKPAVSGAVGVEKPTAREQCRGHANPSAGERATTGR